MAIKVQGIPQLVEMGRKRNRGKKEKEENFTETRKRGERKGSKHQLITYHQGDDYREEGNRTRKKK